MSGFSYSLNSSTIRTTPILEKIAIAAEAGYTGIELWHADIDLYLLQGGSLGDIRHALDDCAIAAPTCIMLKGWLYENNKERDEGMPEVRRRMEQAAELGIPHCIAGPKLGPVDMELAAKRYGELLELGETLGIKPIIEYLGFAEQVNTIEDALYIMEHSGRDDGTVVLDPFHCFRGGGGVEGIAKLRGAQVAISHFNDAPADPPREEQHDPNRVMPGEGIVDLARYVELLKQIGFDGFISLELFREDLWERDPREVAQIGLEKMRAVVEG